jgi:predicted nucleic acid-binding protein
VIGLLGILVLAKERGFLEAPSPLLQERIAAGFYVSDSLCRELLRRVGEIAGPVADPPDDLDREE